MRSSSRCTGATNHREPVSAKTQLLGGELLGDVLNAVSDGMVALLEEFYGHGPTG